MTPDPAFEALRALPRERAGARFTAEVLARAAHQRLSVRGRRTFVLAAVVSIAAATLGVLWHFEGQRDRRARLVDLRAEQRQLAGELADLRRLTAESYAAPAAAEPAFLFLGGDESVDIVVPVLAPGPAPVHHGTID